MNLKKCACGQLFDSSGFFDDDCPDCKRQGKLIEANEGHHAIVESAAQQTAYAASVAAQAQVETAGRIARASEEVAAAKVLQAQLEGTAAMMQAIGGLDDAGAQRLRDHQKHLQDQQMLDDLMNQVSDAVACIEGGGKSTSKINRSAYDGQRSDWDSVAADNSTGVASAVAWHNFVECQQILIDLRERCYRIANWNVPVSREGTIFRIEKYIEQAKSLRVVAASEAVKTIRHNRFIIIATGLVMVSASMGFAMIALYTDTHNVAVECGFAAFFLGLCSVCPFAIVNSGGKRRHPISWEEMVKEASPTAKVPNYMWASVMSLPLVITGITTLIGINGQNNLRTPFGTWQQNGHRLEVSESAMILDTGSLCLNFRPLSRLNNTVMSFTDDVLREGFITDDTCSGTLEVREDVLIVSMSGHRDCNGFTGTWSRVGGVQNDSTPQPTNGSPIPGVPPARTPAATNQADCDVPRDNESFEAFTQRCSPVGALAPEPTERTTPSSAAEPEVPSIELRPERHHHHRSHR